MKSVTKAFQCSEWCDIFQNGSVSALNVVFELNEGDQEGIKKMRNNGR